MLISAACVNCPDEKVLYEVATMRYVAANTTIPVPRIYHFGTAADNPLGLGPFIIMEYVEHEMTMSHALNDPTLGPSDSHSLDPDIGAEKLEFLYSQMANIVLQLSRLTFPKIGSLQQHGGNGNFEVSGRPLIQNMNTMLEIGSIHPALLPSHPFQNSRDWYSAMADMHLNQFIFQRNDAIKDTDQLNDARDKYMARQLFRRLAAENRLAPGFESDDGDEEGWASFRLYSEDLRPSNVLVDKDLRVVGVIDWEFAYAAPSQFAFDPPWWLLLKMPEDWPGGYIAWAEVYEPRLKTFLRVLEAEEEKARQVDDSGSTAASANGASRPLSQRMRQSWESKTWMISYAAKNSWVFDFIFWRFLDAKFFGPNEQADHYARLDLLTLQETEAMERLVKTKVDENKEQTLNKWDYEDAVAHLAKFMV